MSPEPVTLSSEDSEEKAVKLMRARHIRRIPIVDGTRVAGIVTLDDLILSGGADPDSIADVIEVQLAEPAGNKSAALTSSLRPQSAGRADVKGRHQAHADQTLHDFAVRLQVDLGLDSPERALTAFVVLASGLVRRLTPQQAHDFAAELPSTLQDTLLDLRAGPDLDVTRESIELEMAERLDLDYGVAAELVERVGAALGDVVSVGELENVVSQLPKPMKELLIPAIANP